MTQKNKSVPSDPSDKYVKFTYGPWFNDRLWITNESGTCTIATVEYIENGVGAANAALIAAAPEMFTVLAGICQEKSAHICQYSPESCKVCQINNVLKKARGEQ